MQRAEAEYAIGLLCQLQGVRAFSSLTPEGGMVLFSTLTSLTLPPPAPHTTSQESTRLFSSTVRALKTYGTFWAKSSVLTLRPITLLPLHEPSVW